MGALVSQVGQALGHAHALFGTPPDSGPAAQTSGAALAGAGDAVGGGRARFEGSSGAFTAGYRSFTDHAGPPLYRLAGFDRGLGTTVSAGAGTDWSGRAATGAVVDGAASDTTALGPWSGTPAGERVLVSQLRGRLAQQQELIRAYKARDARLAAAARALRYGGRPGGGGGAGMPQMASSPGGLSGAGGGGLGGLSGLAGLPGLAGRRGARTPHTGARGRHPRDIPAGPAGAAVAAALTRQGAPYVWGAKGPTRFDCSGLAQWAWRQAGVGLGGDTYSQITQGVAVPAGQVRAGDLIFPTSSFDGHGPGHVQLAVSPTQVIHAPQSGDVVRVAPMPAAYVARRPTP